MLTIPPQESLTDKKIVAEIIMLEKKLKAANNLIIKQRHSAKEKQNEILKLRENLENEKEAAEEKILNLLEKQRVNSPLTAVRKFCPNKEEELSSQILILEGRIKAQNNMIVNLQDENTALEDIKKSYDEKHKDAEDQISLLEEELNDEKTKVVFKQNIRLIRISKIQNFGRLGCS